MRTGWGPSPFLSAHLKYLNDYALDEDNEANEKFVDGVNDFAYRNCQQHLKDRRLARARATAKRKAIEKAEGVKSHEKTPKEKDASAKALKRKEQWNLDDCYRIMLDPYSGKFVQGKRAWLQQRIDEENVIDQEKEARYTQFRKETGLPPRQPVIPSHLQHLIGDDPVEQFQPEPMDMEINDFQGLIDDLLPGKMKPRKRKHPGFKVPPPERQNKRPKRTGGFAHEHWRATY